MKYVIADRNKAANVGIVLIGHRFDNVGKNVLLNEKEVMNNQVLSGDLDARAEALSGQAYPENTIFQIINKEDWT